MNKFFGILFLLLAGGCSAEDVKQKQPNILLIMLDDAGYNDVAGFSQREVPTPHIEQLASQGVRFTRHYADSTCRPARVSLMTGMQAAKVAAMPDFRGISPEFETLPEKLREAGYYTYHVGKWHLGDTTKLAWPSAQGFDGWFGFLNQFLLRNPVKDPEKKYRRPAYGNPWLQQDDGELTKHKGHLTDILANHAEQKVRELAEQNKPWFINYWMFAPHNPAVPAKYVAKEFPDSKEGQYQALLKQMDGAIGKVITALEETGQKENTIIVVVSDNGGTNERSDNNFPYSGNKGRYSEGGTRTPMFVVWPEKIKPQIVNDDVVAIWDIYPTLLSAANVSVDEDKFDGVNLLPVILENKAMPERPLIWELGSVYSYDFSFLDEVGRWRLDNNRLFDLEKDPFAKTDLAGEKPAIKQLLANRFQQWRKQVHRLNLQMSDTPKGGKIVSGDTLRRSPGYGSFTFAVAVKPDGKKAPVVGTLVEQKNVWSLRMRENHTLYLDINGVTLESPPVDLQDCSVVVFSTFYFRSKLQPKENHAVLTLAVDGEEVAARRIEHPALFEEHLQEVTYLGHDHRGEDAFTGSMENPQFFNEFYYKEDFPGAAKLRELDGEYCQKLSR